MCQAVWKVQEKPHADQPWLSLWCLQTHKEGLYQVLIPLVKGMSWESHKLSSLSICGC